MTLHGGLAPTAAVAKARRENKAWNQNKGGDARVERSSTAAVIQEFIPNAGTYKKL